MIITAAVIALLAVLLFVTAGFWVEFWWFGSVGYRSVLVTRYLVGAAAFVVAAAVATLFFAANWQAALRLPTAAGTPAPSGREGSRLLRIPLWIATAAIALVAGAAAAGSWPTWLFWLNGRSFGYEDPLFGRDAGFYVFALPALSALHRGALVLLAVTGLTVLLVYGLRLGLARIDLRAVPLRIRFHLLGFVAGLLLLVGLGFLLANFGLLSSTRGAVYGPGFTDVNITRWGNYLMALLSVVVAVLVLLNARAQRWRPLALAVGAWAVAAGLLLGLVPTLVQETIVDPAEQSRERPYIARNIAATRAAFDLDRVETRELSGQGEPPAAALTTESPTFDNVRLWDYRVVRANFQAAQSFVPYYRFQDVDVDRYLIDGRLRQVLVSAREFDPGGLPGDPPSWTNQHLAYTHGYGVVVSPVSEAGPTGLPVYLAGAIPPEGAGPFALTRPEIYFGEAEGPWVVVNTEQPEVSGIANDQAAEPYSGLGRGSIRLDGSLRRTMTAIALSDRRLFVSGDISDESRVILRRNIQQRVAAIAPFLRFDDDPYPVIADGRVVWVIDAYTESDRFPGATPREGVNYVRHSVKATVDAYDGTVTFYRTAVPDPIADAYGRAFGELFTPISEAPPAVASHFRYPERLFNLQADTYAFYHVTDPDAFYNATDRWAVGQEQVEGEGTGRDATPQRMEAYYVTLAVPGETEAEFGLVLPFTPARRTNLSAWMAGVADETGAPRLTVYQFPQQIAIPGPEQVENRINTDPVISERITLLDTSGSRVILGNLLVIPVGETVLYAQPFYLRAATGENALTEFEYVILATNERTVLQPTLAEALAALAQGQGTVTAEAPPADGTAPVPPAEPAAADAAAALEAFERGQRALAGGDWAAYGEAQAELEEILRGLAGPAPATVPPATPTP